MINETLSELVAYMSPELIASLEKEKEIVGEDPYAYEPGKIEQRTLETLMRYQIEQGLMRTTLPMQSLFAHEAWSKHR